MKDLHRVKLAIPVASVNGAGLVATRVETSIKDPARMTLSKGGADTKSLPSMDYNSIVRWCSSVHHGFSHSQLNRIRSPTTRTPVPEAFAVTRSYEVPEHSSLE